MKNERELFEIYAVSMCYSVERYDPAVDAGLGGYVSPITVVAWLAWQDAIAHNAQIQAAIDSLMHTTDGVPIVPGMTIYWLHGNPPYGISSLDVDAVGIEKWYASMGNLATDISRGRVALFSTKQAALDYCAKLIADMASKAAEDAKQAADDKEPK